jgi:hypothetical protein
MIERGATLAQRSAFLSAFFAPWSAATGCMSPSRWYVA